MTILKCTLKIDGASTVGTFAFGALDQLPHHCRAQIDWQAFGFCAIPCPATRKNGPLRVWIALATLFHRSRACS
jgi:hypothetical protein